jgi:hypothetical protein
MKPLTLKHCLALTILALGLMFAVAFLCDYTFGPLKLHYVFEIAGSFFLGLTIAKMRMPDFFQFNLFCASSMYKRKLSEAFLGRPYFGRLSLSTWLMC